MTSSAGLPTPDDLRLGADAFPHVPGAEDLFAGDDESRARTAAAPRARRHQHGQARGRRVDGSPAPAAFADVISTR
jgi:hypothetical protein